MTNFSNAHQKALVAAALTTQAFCDKHFAGKDGGPCGFAWVTLTGVHGNSRTAKEAKSLGYRKSYGQKGLELYNPSGWHGQSVDAKYAGASEYARVMREETGLDVYATDRLD